MIILNNSERGSITLYVTLSCVFLITVLSLAVFNVTNKNTNQKRQLDRIEDIYSVTDDDLEQTYQEKKRPNWQ